MPQDSNLLPQTLNVDNPLSPATLRQAKRCKHHHTAPSQPSPDDMNVEDREALPANSDSSDWEDWADAMEGQDEPARDAAEEAEKNTVEGASDGCRGGPDAEEEAWVKSMVDQGTDCSVVQGADSRAWDYVLEMAIQEHESSGGIVTTPVQEVAGAAALEFVGRWLGGNLPHSGPALQTLRHISSVATAAGGSQDGGSSKGIVGRTMADAVSRPSALAMVSCSTGQRLPRVVLFSLNANSGAALAAEIVQPEAAGLVASLPRLLDNSNSRSSTRAESDRPIRPISWPDEMASRDSDKPRYSEGRMGSGHRGVVFESLDSRILEGALASAMGRVGLGIECRSRSGMWRLPTGAQLTNVPDLTIINGAVQPLLEEDAAGIARASLPRGAQDCSMAESLVRGLIRRNGGAGIRRGGHLVSWCLSFDSGLAGALHVPGVPPVAAEAAAAAAAAGVAEYSATTAREDATAIVLYLLLDPISQQQQKRAGNNSLSWPSLRVGSSACSRSASAANSSNSSCSSSGNSSSRAFVLDDNSPFVALFQELGLERVCDADWLRFIPDADSDSSVVDRNGAARVRPIGFLVTRP